MAISLFSSGTTTPTLSTETTLATVSVAGTFVCNVDTFNMALGDATELRAYHMTTTTSRIAYVMIYYGAQPTDDTIKEGLPIGNTLSSVDAVKYTIKQRIGTARAYYWEVLQY
jgi:hypothetical protein